MQQSHRHQSLPHTPSSFSPPHTDQCLQAELQTDRQKVALFDSSATPILSLAPGARHDFIVAHDVKEVGPHTLACSTVYITAAGERKYYPQYFKFASHNPLSVRTKVPALS